MSSKGNLIIISAPSGSGKSSLASGLFRNTEGVVFSVSHTTRRPRGKEKDGEDYFFIEEDRFRQMADQGDFLEYAHVYGNYYGTSRSFVQEQLAAGNDVLLDIDVQGALKVKEQVPEALMVFVLPPSFGELEKRLINRGMDDPEVIAKRLKIASREIKYYKDYDYVIINSNLKDAIEELRKIVLSGRRPGSALEGGNWAAAETVVSTFPDDPEGGHDGAFSSRTEEINDSQDTKGV